MNAVEVEVKSSVMKSRSSQVSSAMRPSQVMQPSPSSQPASKHVSKSLGFCKRAVASGPCGGTRRAIMHGMLKVVVKSESRKRVTIDPT